MNELILLQLNPSMFDKLQISIGEIKLKMLMYKSFQYLTAIIITMERESSMKRIHKDIVQVCCGRAEELVCVC